MQKLVRSGVFMVAVVFYGVQSQSTGAAVVGAVLVLLSLAFGRNSSGPTEQSSDWSVAAAALGLDARPGSRRGPARMTGTIDGHRVRVRSSHPGRPKIEVDFDSGLRQLDIKPKRPGIDRGLLGPTTGDPAFDSTYDVVRLGGDEASFLSWLTAERRDILVTLAQALEIDEIEEDEIEARLPVENWSPSDLVEAVRLCVLVARVLDASNRSPDIEDAVIQDAVIEDAMVQDASAQ